MLVEHEGGSPTDDRVARIAVRHRDDAVVG
jgi:hypothetical protein